MRLLIFLLALMSAFFVSKVHAFRDPDLSNLVEPKQKMAPCEQASFNGSGGHKVCGGPDANGSDIKKQSCDLLAGDVQPESTNEYDWTTATCIIEGGTYKIKQDGVRIYSDGYRLPTSRYWSLFFANLQGELTYSCPPDGHPENTIEVPNSESGLPAIEAGFYCAKIKEPEDCPAGYHSKAVSKAMGGSECMPKDCPATGSGTSLASSKMTGGVPFSGGGMYCNDGCAYSVPESNITSQNYALGVSQGAACGDKPYDNKKLSEHDDGSKCELNSNGDVSVLFCSDPATPPDGTEPPKPDDPIAPVDNDDLKKDNTKTPDKPLLNCANEDVACQIENLKIQAENDAKNLREDQVDRFNNALDSDTRNTNAIIGAIEAFHTTVYIADQKADTYQLLAQSQIERLITTVENGSSTGGGSGGDDTGTGGGGGGSDTGGGDGGDGDGEPCEGSFSDCVPIEDAELPVAQVNLNQYADQYNDWLPTAELPEKSCVSLTDGTSLCLDFSSIILIFKALSSLLVISALLHSAKIISGAF